MSLMTGMSSPSPPVATDSRCISPTSSLGGMSPEAAGGSTTKPCSSTAAATAPRTAGLEAASAALCGTACAARPIAAAGAAQQRKLCP